MDVRLENWPEAAASASTLGELELTLGAVARAVGDAEQSVTYANRSGDAFLRMALRTPHADALHQAGRRAEAETRFREAEQMQAESQPEYPLLYSVRGFRYCDLLLAAPERAAWSQGAATFLSPSHDTAPEAHTQAATRQVPGDFTPGLSGEVRGSAAVGSTATGMSPLLESCRAVSQRAAQTLQWVEAARMDILSIALDHLTLGRAALYAAILQNSDLRVAPPGSAPALSRQASALTADLSYIDTAVAGLRRAGQAQELPRGLLTRAWLRFLTGARTGPASAQEDLDEAWEIAERGSMKLFLADIHLHRARLFGRMKDEGGRMKYPWESPEHDLAEARRLIEECGYGRRKEELEDAERALAGQ